MRGDMNMKGCGCNSRRSGGCHGDCQKSLQNLRALDFAIQETVLYLDAYPECKQALEYYHILIQQRNEELALHESTCGPITMYGNTDRTEWKWVKSPWPWEVDAN